MFNTCVPSADLRRYCLSRFLVHLPGQKARQDPGVFADRQVKEMRSQNSRAGDLSQMDGKMTIAPGDKEQVAGP